MVSASERTAGSHLFHELIESFSHSSRNAVAWALAAAGMAPSEWLMRCTPFSRVGNSARVARRRDSSWSVSCEEGVSGTGAS